MSQLTPFNFHTHRVRVVEIDGEPWFVVNDVCTALEITNSRDAVSRLDGDDVGTADVIDSLGRTQKANTVSESGLYELIFQSRKSEARDFRRWVTREVLPQIRKTGSYAEPMSELELARRYLASVEAREAAKLALAAAEAERDEAKNDLQEFHAAPEWLSAGQVANTLGVGRTTFFKMLREAGVVFKDQQQGGHRVYQDYINRGWAEARWEPWPNGPGHSWTPYFTRTGVTGIRKILGISDDTVKEIAQ